jgi:xylan 1,4-beta-xylosidase
MKGLLLRATIFWAAAATLAVAADSASSAHFAWVSYSGHDPIEATRAVTAAEYRNPIIPGFQPDPSIVRVGNDYYLINSSFAFFPGIPIFHSRDLVNWEQLGNAIDRPGQFDFTGLEIRLAIFAATIRWHDGRFYIVGTCVECGFNFVLNATNPRGPWSDPVWLKSIDGVDPDLFFDSDGRVWIVNSGPPPGIPAYEGHRAIWLQELDLGHMTVIGPRSLILDRGAQPDSKPIWIEGPHLIKKDGWYYLIAAQGGTASGHSEVVFRSKVVTGPYTAGPSNPILTQRDLEPTRPFPVAATGHADFVQAEQAGWWSVFLATRPYEANLSNLGRETFLLPVTWRGGWPQILAPQLPVPQILPRPRLPAAIAVDRSQWRDNFDSPQLAADWEMIRTPTETWYRLTPGAALRMEARAVSLSGSGNPSFLGKRQRHENAVVETEMRYSPGRVGDQAGLVAFADERHHYFLGLRQTPEGPALVVSMRNGASDPEEGRTIASDAYEGGDAESIRLRITARGAAYDFSYAIGAGPWRMLLANAEGRILASEPTNLFTGTLIGLYATRSAINGPAARPSPGAPE